MAVRIPSSSALKSLTIEALVSWEFDSPFDAGQLAALHAGKHIVYTAPAAGWALSPLFEALPPLDGEGRVAMLVLAPTSGDVVDIAEGLFGLPGLDYLHPVTGIARAAGLLRRRVVRTLASTPDDALQLLRHACLKLEALDRIAVVWPSGEHSDALDTILAECTGAQRLIVTDDERSVEGFLERHARRAVPVRASRPPDTPIRDAKYTIIGEGRRAEAVRAALDVLDPETAVLWEPVPGRRGRLAALADAPGIRQIEGPAVPARHADLAIALDLPSRAVLETLGAAANDVLVLIRGRQLPYLQRLVQPVRFLRLPGAADRARGRFFESRREIRARIDGMDPTGTLVALEPLFDEFDPALVAAALFSQGQAEDAEGDMGSRAADPGPDEATFARVWISVGRRDRVRPGDVVGALINAVGLRRNHIGRVDIRESFSLVEVRAEESAGAVSRLAGVTLKGKRVRARIDTQ